MAKNLYVGLGNDHFGGMIPIGNIIKDAWLFGILPETEACENWTHGQPQNIAEKVKTEWDRYGCLVSNLPDELKKRHAAFNDKAVKKARDLGWDPTPPADEV